MIHQHPESFPKHFLWALLLQRTRLKALGMKMAKALLFGCVYENTGQNV